jgi:hypothetical protein
MQEYKKEGLNVAGMHIEEHEVEQWNKIIAKAVNAGSLSLNTACVMCPPDKYLPWATWTKNG